MNTRADAPTKEGEAPVSGHPHHVSYRQGIMERKQFGPMQPLVTKSDHDARIARLLDHIEAQAVQLKSIEQAITDPENQPSQYGTVTIDFHLEKVKAWEDRFHRMSDQFDAQSVRLEAAVLAEREACAKVCEAAADTDANDYNEVRRECAAAIRHRAAIASEAKP